MPAPTWRNFKDGLYKAVTDAAECLEKEVLKVNDFAERAQIGLTTKKRDSWNKRFYLAVLDARTVTQCVPNDVETIRGLAHAAGAVGHGFISDSDNYKTQEVDIEGIPSLWVWPKSFEDPLDVPTKMLYLHGGAFCIGSKATHKQLGVQLQKKGNCAVLLPDYRCCPENTVSEARADTMAVYKWLAARAPSSNVVVGGDSAGANLALGLALDIRRQIHRPFPSTAEGQTERGYTNAGASSPSVAATLSMPAGLVLISPWVDLVDSILREKTSWRENEDLDFITPELAERFARWVVFAQKIGGTRGEAGKIKQAEELEKEELVQLASSHEVSPGLSPDGFAGLPKVLVLTGGGETLRDSQLELVSHLRRDGVATESEVYHEMPHAFVLCNFLCTDTCQALGLAVDRAAAFVTSCTLAGRNPSSQASSASSVGPVSDRLGSLAV